MSAGRTGGPVESGRTAREGSGAGGAGGSFTSDTIVDLANAVGTDVPALELLTSLTNNGAGTEASRFQVKLLTAGAQVLALDVQPNATFFRDGSKSAPSIAFTSKPGTGFAYNAVLDQLTIAFNGDGTNYLTFGNFTTGAGLVYQGLIASGFANAAGLQFQLGAAGSMIPTLFTLTNDVVIGVDGAMATNATHGYLQIPSCAGAPTGLSTLRSGHVALHYDATNNKIYVNNGGTWRSTAALT